MLNKEAINELAKVLNLDEEELFIEISKANVSVFKEENILNDCDMDNLRELKINVVLSTTGSEDKRPSEYGYTIYSISRIKQLKEFIEISKKNSVHYDSVEIANSIIDKFGGKYVNANYVDAEYKIVI